MDESDPAVTPPPLAGPFRLHTFRPRGRPDVGTRTLFVHEWTASGFTVRGVVGLLDLTGGHCPSARAVVLPHERVHADQVHQLAGRMARGRVDTAPILLAHRGPVALRSLLDEVCSEPPRLVRNLRDQRHRVWALSRPSELELVAAELAGTSALLADGHHRYAAHLRLQRSGTRGSDRALSVLVDHEDTPLHLGAIHRVLPGPVLHVARRQGWGVVTVGTGSPLREVAPGRVVVWEAGLTHVLTLPPTPGPPGGSGLVTTATMPVLAVERMLAQLPTGDTSYHHEAEAALAEAGRRDRSALLLPAPTLDEVLSIVRQGRLLPEKATSFQPKPRPGLLTRRLRDV
ncbi:DUF1015 domain-containing protein [Nocardioides marinus]|uniref:DUF1015 domain-containing protein n=1 Tax=Nocardioides marinus TaxID=374514 RepID=A0A7Y9YDW7_9ACTN|nr:DUF1015 family protein [Nocardioides marinus]NYI10423.1 hypothetical protein [Nocardioides marinus]